MGKEEELVRGVEGHDVPRASLALHERAQPPVGEDPRDEIVAKPQIGQAALFLHGQQRIRVHEALREEAAPRSRGHARF